MMDPLHVLDEAELKMDMRRTYNELGPTQSVSVVYQLLLAAEIMMQVIVENRGQKNSGLSDRRGTKDMEMEQGPEGSIE